ncbi:MAG: carboxypeptidase-like regulatory domain-containing protein, partial [Bacteroidales bacterium]|nr:carboxypeptidase-like regulatory domain-containing protein [Bacteroidales bacterium]
MNKKSVLLIAFLMGVLLCGWGGFSLLAQTRAADGFPVRGKVTDEKGDGFAGVSVIIKGTNIGVDTDLSGSYQVFVPNSVQNPVIEFSFLGMKTQSFELTRKATVLNVEMKEDQNSIESAVVTGYGT